LKNKKISFWIEENFALYSSKPIVEKYYKNGYEIYIYTSSIMGESTKYYLSEYDVTVINTDKLGNFISKTLDKFYRMLLVNKKFSVMYCFDINKYNGKMYNLLNTIFLVKVTRQKINDFYYDLLSLFNTFRFQGDKVIAYTFVSKPYLFANKRTKTILIMESWDHLVKRPHFIRPNVFLTWNKDLKQDAKIIQNHSKVFYIYPTKLRYTEDRKRIDALTLFNSISNQSYIKDLLAMENKKIILYPVTLTSLDNFERYKGEIELIKSLARSISNTEYTLFIKPKPTGPIGDYDTLKHIKNIVIGEYTPNTNKIDMLDENYHTYRYLLMKYSLVVINVGTTFGLDAAMAGKPVMQLDILGERFGTFVRYSKNPHIEKYLLNNHFTFKYSGIEVININQEMLDRCQKYSNNLRKWLLNDLQNM
jgi:hypothetical protein